VRLFVALDIPEEVRAAISEQAARLRGIAREARWARVEGLHVTLKFIGEMPEDPLAAIQSALQSVPFPAPIAMTFRGLGFFPNERRPRVLWVGIEAGPELPTLASAIDVALVPLGVMPEKRAFSPHLTLARFDEPRPEPKLREAVEALGPAGFGAATAHEFHLYRSVLKRGGAEYTRLMTFPCRERL
jgi:2'-5' RNA ligase